MQGWADAAVIAVNPPRIERARQHGTEIVTSEMVLFEWLRDLQHTDFREVRKLLK